jgi:hypothetical protein
MLQLIYQKFIVRYNFKFVPIGECEGNLFSFVADAATNNLECFDLVLLLRASLLFVKGAEQPTLA